MAMAPSDPLLVRLDLIAGLLALLVLGVVVLATAVNLIVGLVGGGLLVAVALVAGYSYLVGVRAFVEAAG
ncbi:hypothetical protein [Salinigranum sp. GCM10025319]|uniref:hypothetical protein n=1 Tax=Salinigranum sp. GCM10025319 TaxID=3252687 RepID=UPI0036203FF7